MKLPFLISILTISVYSQTDTYENLTTGTTPLVEERKISPQQIIKELFGPSYDKRVRPPNIDSNGNNLPVTVTSNIYIRAMSNIDFVRMEYTLQLTFRESWRDPRLQYANKGKKVPKFIIATNHDAIWKPDTFFQNEKQAHRHMIDTPNILVRIHPDGTVLYSERLSLVLSCQMHLKKYPMDKQQCSLMMASYAYTNEDIEYVWKDDGAIQLHPMLEESLPCFKLVTITTSNCSSVTTTGEYSCIKTTFDLHRLFSYYLVQLYIPSTLLVIVSWVSFWMDRSAVPARVTLGVTTLLTMTTHSAAINQSLPAVAYLKSADVWLGTCLIFVFAGVLEFAFVSFYASYLEAKHKNEERRREQKDQMQTCDKHVTTPDSTASTVRNDESPLMPGSVIQEVLIDGQQPRKRKRTLTDVLKPLIPVKFYKKMQLEADEAKIVDVRARVLFPAAFVVFNIIYWIWHATL